MSAVGLAVGDGVVLAKRNLTRTLRVPDLMMSSLIMPIMSTLLFAYIFGSAIQVPGVSYTEFLLVGVFVQTVVFNSVITGSGLAEDIQKGIVDRFRSLPISPYSVLIGRTISDLANNVLSIVVMVVTGLLVGWRIDSSLGEAAAGFLLLLAFAYALSWVLAVVGLSVRAPEVVTNASFMIIMPLCFIANTYVSPEGFPSVLRVIAEWNPVSAVTQAVRELFGNTNPDFPPGAAWPLQNSVLASFLWIVVMLVVFVPFATSRYRKAVAR
ncbi:ABC transporter permease [Lentzea flaviverrucosa]|uniref:Transport permease protein n=1 Tax=Lentzea flaviverrucosa TaxID=200379 RepID=A0A1H9HLR4_9PSEU|nr:ABC transporter permease [Lentzea flaviverrucosa]RDI34549.1 ABC transporter DrrB family efflux protein [Lentzea flaviverrucosa]SEQ63172.1 ABC transporter efflux protein, DrrB family [Lentzea flaviverrucosa]